MIPRMFYCDLCTLYCDVCTLYCDVCLVHVSMNGLPGAVEEIRRSRNIINNYNNNKVRIGGSHNKAVGS